MHCIHYELEILQEKILAALLQSMESAKKILGYTVLSDTVQGRHTHLLSLTLTCIHTHFQMHALSPEGTLSMCYADDPPTLVYLKKQMEQGTCRTFTCRPNDSVTRCPYDVRGCGITVTCCILLDILELPGLSRGRAQSQIRASTKIKK